MYLGYTTYSDKNLTAQQDKPDFREKYNETLGKIKREIIFYIKDSALHGNTLDINIIDKIIEFHKIK
jgi:hypothetical protein